MDENKTRTNEATPIRRQVSVEICRGGTMSRLKLGDGHGTRQTRRPGRNAAGASTDQEPSMTEPSRKDDDLQTLAELVAAARSGGADAADALVVRNVSMSQTQRMGETELLEREEGQDLGLSGHRRTQASDRFIHRSRQGGAQRNLRAGGRHGPRGSRRSLLRSGGSRAAGHRISRYRCS